jgi:hypothetical protein
MDLDVYNQPVDHIDACVIAKRNNRRAAGMQLGNVACVSGEHGCPAAAAAEEKTVSNMYKRG